MPRCSPKQIQVCEIRGSHTEATEELCLLGYYTMSTGKEVKMFRRAVPLSSSGSSSPKGQEQKTTSIFRF